MWDIVSELLGKMLSGFGEKLAAFGPNLLAMLLILTAGIIVAGAAHLLARFVLARLGFDRLARQWGVNSVLQFGRREPSRVVAAVIAWLVLGVFLLLAVSALDLAVAVELVSKAFAYLPNVLVAVLILVIGSLVSAFLRRSVLIAAVNAGLPSAHSLAAAVHVALMVVFVAMALEHLGVGRQVILISFAILFGGLVLALALAFGLAGRDLARDYLERVVRGREEGAGDELRHL